MTECLCYNCEKERRDLTKPCNCSLCKMSNQFKELEERRDVDGLISFCKKLMDNNCNIGEDLCYHQAICDGSWENAEDILLLWLEKVRQLKKETTLKIDTEKKIFYIGDVLGKHEKLTANHSVTVLEIWNGRLMAFSEPGRKHMFEPQQAIDQGYKYLVGNLIEEEDLLKRILGE
jgi:hypothetical protein